MNSLCTSAFVRELSVLVKHLQERRDPVLKKFLPFYSAEGLRQVAEQWDTINCIRQELVGVQVSLQQLSSLLISQTQLLSHPSGCRSFTLHTVEDTPFLSNVELPTKPTRKRPSNSKRPRVSKAKKLNNGDRQETPAAICSAIADEQIEQETFECINTENTLQQELEQVQQNYVWTTNCMDIDAAPVGSPFDISNLMQF